MATLPITKVADRMGTPSYRTWLDKPVITLSDFRLTIENHGTIYPSTHALRRLDTTLRELSVRSLAGLFRLNMTDLAAHDGVGFRQLMAAACVLEANGYNVDDWISDHGTRTVESRARTAVERGKKRKAGKRTYRKGH